MSQPPDHQQRRHTASNVLIAIGAVVLLGVAGYLLWNEVQGARLRAQLRATPTPTATPMPVNPTAAPSPSVLLPTPLPSPAPAETGALPSPTAAALVAAEPTGTPAPTTAIAPAVPLPTGAPEASVAEGAAGQPVRMAISELGIDVPVVEMGWDVVQTAQGPQTEWVIPENEAGHHIDSVQLGEPGNLVISGHNNIYGRVFEPISLAWPGQASRVDDVTERSDILNGRTIQLYNQAGQRFDYVITDFLRLKDTGIPLAQRVENARFMRPTGDTRLTLVTCWPPWSNTHRLIVIAKPATQS